MYPSLNFIDLARWALSLPLTITWENKKAYQYRDSISRMNSN